MALCSVRGGVRAQGTAQRDRVWCEHNSRCGGRDVVHILAAAADDVSQHHHATARDRSQPLRSVRLARRVSQDRRLHGSPLHQYVIYLFIYLFI